MRGVAENGELPPVAPKHDGGKPSKPLQSSNPFRTRTTRSWTETQYWTRETLDVAERAGQVYRVKDQYYHTLNGRQIDVRLVPEARPVDSPPSSEDFQRGPGEVLSQQTEQVTATGVQNSGRTPARDIPFNVHLARLTRYGTPTVERMGFGPRPDGGKP